MELVSHNTRPKYVQTFVRLTRPRHTHGPVRFRFTCCRLFEIRVPLRVRVILIATGSQSLARPDTCMILAQRGNWQEQAFLDASLWPTERTLAWGASSRTTRPFVGSLWCGCAHGTVICHRSCVEDLSTIGDCLARGMSPRYKRV